MFIKTAIINFKYYTSILFMLVIESVIDLLSGKLGAVASL